MTAPAFEWICEIEPPTKPDMMHVRHQIGVLSKVASAYLIPDNHVGRATVSSIAVAHEVDRMGGRSIACLNATAVDLRHRAQSERRRSTCMRTGSPHR
jgi:methylenetetrahydrofolate reductase (NADPH)